MTNDLAPAKPYGNWMWQRQLAHYPVGPRRYAYLGITVIATVVLYYELYVQGAVAINIMRDFGMSFTQYVWVAISSTIAGALASVAAGLADRWGRANLVVAGLFSSGLLVLVGLPHASNKTAYMVIFALLGVVEGVTLVATPALIRDFSPQLGRASAMGFWALGPVLGSLIVTEVSSSTLDSHPSWQFQFYVCGVAGLIVAAIAFIGLRELSPRLRDQLMVSMNDRLLIEARAAGIDPEAALKGGWRQMLKFDIVGSALAISLFLMFYYILVSFVIVYFATIFGYSEARANALGNWYWITNVIALVLAGALSDKLRVRKPFMAVGTVISMIGTGIFAVLATKPATSYYTFAVVFVVIAIGVAMTYCAWMASFTETVERHNPAATATGLAVWGGTLRAFITVALIVFAAALPATSVLVDRGPQVTALAAKYHDQIATATAVSPVALASLQKNPADPAAGAAAVGDLMKAGLASDPQAAVSRLTQLATRPIPAADAQYLAAHGAEVQQAAKDSPRQWQRWWWICFACQVLFLPFLFIIGGRWSPARAREDAEQHEALVQRELATL
ncbi:MFS transporter [Nocardia sp. NPDC059239]|uniref:MFS transporter n=1 Tax=unclassified Nocardia TaxID=2637762 RepID=UPI0036C7148A